MFCPPFRRPGHSDTDVPVLGLLVAVLLLLLLGGGGFVVWQRQRMRAMEAAVRAEAMMAEEQAELAERARAEAGRRPNEVPMADLHRDGPRPAAVPALERGLALCGEGKINEGMLWLVRGLEQSGDDGALQRVFRANLASWGHAPAGLKLLSQKGAVTALALGPDGKVTLTGGEDGVARAWRTDGGQVVGEAPRGVGTVSALGFGAGGKEWLAANGDRVARLDAATGQPAGEPVEPPGHVLAMIAKADHKLLIFGTCNQGVWLSEDGARDGAVKLFTPPSPVLSAALGPDMQVILTGHEDRTVRAWGADGKAVGQPLSHDAPVRAVAVSADGKRFATAAGKAARLWDGATHLPIGRPLTHEADVTALAFTPDGKALLAGDQGGSVRRWTVPGPVAGDVRRLKLWVEVMARQELDAGGAFRPLNEPTVKDRRQKLQALGGPLTP